jgi:O-antigen/teichoic acid export membrane protein
VSAVNLSARPKIVRNVGYGVLDYLVQPLLMLASARYFIHHLGISQFGLWMLILTIIGSSGTLCTGFGDAALKYVSMMRGRFDYQRVTEVIRTSITINLGFGLAMALVLCGLAPWGATHVFHLRELAPSFTLSLRIAACVLVVRSVTFVFISTVRAFEHYRVATQVNSAERMLVVVSAIFFAGHGHGVPSIMLMTLGIDVLALVALGYGAQQLAGRGCLLPSFNVAGWRPLVSFGTFSWLQALAGTIFSQADRVIVASLLGPAELGFYALCVQVSQPIHGLIASGSNVLFPHLSARAENASAKELLASSARAFRLTCIAIALLASPLIFGSRLLFRLWMGPAFAQHAASSLSVVALSFALLAFNIPGHYALLALGRVRFVTAVNLVGGALSLGLALLLVPRFGILGAAMARLAYGPVTWLIYLKLDHVLRTRQSMLSAAPQTV